MTKTELDEILYTYNWIKVGEDPVEENYNSSEEYAAALKQHHIEETEFLIAVVKELAEDLYDAEQSYSGYMDEAKNNNRRNRD